MARDYILSASAIAPLGEICAIEMSSVGNDLSTLCGREVSFGPPTVHILGKYRLPRPYEEPCVYTLASLEGAFVGNVRWLLRFRDAITLSSLMLLVPPVELERKRMLREFSAMDADAYREACNNLCGGAAQGLREAFGVDLSMVQRESRFVDIAKSRADWNAIFPPPPFVMVEFPLTISGWPPSVCAQILEREVLEALLKAKGVEQPFEDVRGTILQIDENEGAQAQLSSLLAGLPYHLYSAPNLALAVDGIDVESVQLVVVDIGNSANDGFGTLRRLRSTARYAHLPVIMCCAKGLLRREYVVRALQSGAKDFVAKPFDRDLLLRKIEKHALTLAP